MVLLPLAVVFFLLSVLYFCSFLGFDLLWMLDVDSCKV
jgi:hypothetical protein